MEYKKVLVVGGTGLVGHAVCNKLLSEGVSTIIIISLGNDDEMLVFNRIKKEFPSAEVIHETGNILYPTLLKDKTFKEIEANQNNLDILNNFLVKPFSDEITKESFFYYLIQKYNPQVIIDCVNTASHLSYTSIKGLNPLLVLTRFIQIFYQTMLSHQNIVRSYVKIGTTGTGGMGLNIPYTHGEVQPSQALLTKSAISGAHTQLLFLLSRSPNMPAIYEIKPAAIIAWGNIANGQIKKGTKCLYMDKDKLTINLEDFKKNKEIFCERNDLSSGKPLETTFLDSGENGLFSLEEFRTITSLRQMEFVRPEEIAKLVWLELNGKHTGRDMITAYESGVLNPSYEAGYLRTEVLERLENLARQAVQPSVAFELLGPPRLSKLLFEAFLLKSIEEKPDNLSTKSAEAISQDIEKLLVSNKTLLLTIISTGIPILLGDGKTLYRGSTIKVQPDNRNFKQAASGGWVDLRVNNIALWQKRIKDFTKQHPANFQPGDIVAFIFETEFRGYRI